LIQAQIIAAMTGTNMRATWCWLKRTTGMSKMVMARIIVDKWDIVSKYRRVTS
jgi:hypothetical protein